MATELEETQFDEFDIENGLPAFLLLVLDKLEEFFGNATTDISDTQTLYMVVDKTDNLLRYIAE